MLDKAGFQALASIPSRDELPLNYLGVIQKPRYPGMAVACSSRQSSAEKKLLLNPYHSFELNIKMAN